MVHEAGPPHRGYQCCKHCKALLCVPPESEIDERPHAPWPPGSLVDDTTWGAARANQPVCWESRDIRYRKGRKP